MFLIVIKLKNNLIPYTQNIIFTIKVFCYYNLGLVENNDVVRKFVPVSGTIYIYNN